MQNDSLKENIWEIFEGASLKAFIIGGLVLFQQIIGQPNVLYYATSILQTVGFAAASEAARVSILIGLFKLLMAGVAVFKVDDLGRRPLLIGGVGGIASSLYLLAAYYKILILQQKRGGLLTSTLGKCILQCAYKLKAQASCLGAWEFQMTWDPGGLVLLLTSWHRLGDKPRFN